MRDQPESQHMSGHSSRTTVFLAKRASTSDADGPKAFPDQVSASESYWSSQETFPTTFLTLLRSRPCKALCPVSRYVDRAYLWVPALGTGHTCYCRITSARALLSDGKSPNRQGNLSAHHETADAPAGSTYKTSVNHFVNRSAARRRAAATQFIHEFLINY